MRTPRRTEPGSDGAGGERWVELRILVPADWKRWLEEAANARALSVSALVRQCIRELMISRHRQEGAS